MIGLNWSVGVQSTPNTNCRRQPREVMREVRRQEFGLGQRTDLEAGQCVHLPNALSWSEVLLVDDEGLALWMRYSGGEEPRDELVDAKLYLTSGARQDLKSIAQDVEAVGLLVRPTVAVFEPFSCLLHSNEQRLGRLRMARVGKIVLRRVV